MSDIVLPSFDAQSIANASKRKALTLGWYRFVITEAKVQVSKNGHYMVVTQNAPLKDPEDAGSAVNALRVRNNLVMPFDNTAIEDHKGPNTTGLVLQFLRSVGYDIPTYPRMEEGVLMYNGEEIEKADEDACRQETTQMIWDTGLELLTSPDELVDCAFYAEVVQNGDFTNINNPSAELPDEAMLVSEDEFEASADVEVKTRGGKKASSKSSKKTTSKKKTSRRSK